MQAGISNSTSRILSLILLLGTFHVSVGLCQTGVQVKLSDQTLPQKVHSKPHRVILASGSIELPQESDFEPKRTKQKGDGLIRLDLDNMEPPKPTDKNKNNALDQNQIDFGASNQEDDPTISKNSDAPVNPPEFKPDEFSSNDPSTNESNAGPDKPANNEQYRLPPVANVNAPISSMPLSMVNQNDPSGLLAKDQNVNLNQAAVFPGMTYANVSGKPSSQKFKTWQAHNFYHRPLYFEQPNVEQHGNRRSFNNVASPVHFFATIPRLPYKIGEKPPYQRVYTHGQVRPGDYTQFQIRPSTGSRRGNVLQTLVRAAIILP